MQVFAVLLDKRHAVQIIFMSIIVFKRSIVHFKRRIIPEVHGISTYVEKKITFENIM